MDSQKRTSKQEAYRKQKSSKYAEEGHGNSSNDSGDNRSDDSEERDSFIVDDDYQEEDDNDFSSQENRKKKKHKEKKEKKQSKKKKKKNRRNDSDQDSVMADDLEVIDQAHGNLKRLKKNKQKNYKQQQEDDYAEEQYDQADLDRGQDSYYGQNQFNQYDQYDEDDQFRKKKNQEADLDDLIDERVRKQFYAETTDKQIVSMDLPERQIIKYKNYAKILENTIEAVQKEFESEERLTEAKWIFKRLRSMGYFEVNDQKQCLGKIENVLLAMHRQHLEIMYIYYYRKKIWQDALNLNLLMKIQEIDEQWMTFKKQFKALQHDVTSVFPSFHHVPKSVPESLKQCTQIRHLKYFKDYSFFIMSKRKSEDEMKSSNRRVSFIKKISDSGLDNWLTSQEPFLSPHNFYENIKDRVQRKKPLTPQFPPDKMLRKLLKQKGKEEDEHKQAKAENDEEGQKKDEKKKDSLLQPSKLITILIDYLAFELFSYPEIRRSLKEKYFRKLLFSTVPTTQGIQHINIYNMFFPIKRVKDKPVNSLKRQHWVLAREAERLGLIQIELKFEWELSNNQRKNFEGDPVYSELVKYYFDISSQSSGQNWNLLRKSVLVRMLTQYFLPSFIEEVKQDLTREATKQIIQQCCQKFRNQLSRKPGLLENKPMTILAMVLEGQKLGLAFVDQQGKQHSALSIQLKTDEQLRKFVSDTVLQKLFEDNKPDTILVAANCRRAQTLRKQLRNPNLFGGVFCEFGDYQVPSLMANKNIIQGHSAQKCILEAISMARLKKNPLAQILGLWSDSIQENGVYSMNLHPLQKFINKRKLIDSLQKVAIEVVNLVGVNIDDIRNSDHCRNVLQFISGLGPRKAFDLIEKVKAEFIFARIGLLKLIKSNYVYINCSPFIKFERDQHLELVDRSRNTFKQQVRKDKKKNKQSGESQINLLDMTRIPVQWYPLAEKLFMQAIKPNSNELKYKKSLHSLSEEQMCIRQMFKNSDKLRMVQWDSRREENRFFDENLVKAEIINNFKDPRQSEKQMDTKSIFYSLLKESPETLKKFMVVTVRILSVNQQYLNVVIPQNGLFGYIKLISNDKNNQRESKVKYQKGMYIKAVITGFPFDERRLKDKQQTDHEQELLKVDMALNFPHRSEDKSHDCQRLCFPGILKQIHPNMDLDKQTFDLSKQSLPIVEVVEQAQQQRPKTQFKRITHPKFKTVNMATAVQEVKKLPVGQFIIRPSTQGNNFLTITWHFYKGIVSHIKLKCEQRSESQTMLNYRVLDKNKDKVYSSIDQVIQGYVKPMNKLVQDVISNKKFLSVSIQNIEQKIRTQSTKDQSYIQYFFGCSPQYPQFFLLVYMYKEKKPTKQLVRVRNDGLLFHDQTFNSIRDVIGYFKEHLKDRKYQSYVKSASNIFKK